MFGQPVAAAAGPHDAGVQRVNLAQFAALRQLHRRGKVADAAPLRADLKDAPITLHRVVHGLNFRNAGADRLFGVHVFAGARRHNRTQAMPAVAGRNQHGIDVGARQQFAQIAVGATIFVTVVLIGHVLNGFALFALHIANRDELNALFRQHCAQHLPATRLNANRAQDDFRVRRHSAIQAEHARRHDEWKAQRGSGRK